MLLEIISCYYVNTSETPGELCRVNMISSHVKITCYFTCENSMLFSQVKGFPLLWLHNPLDLLLYHRDIIGSSSEIFGCLQKSTVSFGDFRKKCLNVWKRSSCLRTTFDESSESVRKSSENRQKRRH